MLFKNPRDKSKILTLAKQVNPRQTDFLLNQYEKALKRPFGYLLIHLKTTTQDNCPLRTNVVGEEGFNQAGFQENISQELLKYLKQQNLSPVMLLPAMQEIQGNIDDVLYRNDLRDDLKAKRYFQLQNRYLAFKEQLIKNTTERNNQWCSRLNIKHTRFFDSNDSSVHSPPPFNVTPELTQAAVSQKPVKESFTPPPPLNPDPSFHSRNSITTRTKAQKASDSLRGRRR